MQQNELAKMELNKLAGSIALKGGCLIAVGATIFIIAKPINIKNIFLKNKNKSVTNAEFNENLTET